MVVYVYVVDLWIYFYFIDVCIVEFDFVFLVEVVCVGVNEYVVGGVVVYVELVDEVVIVFYVK